MSFDVANLCLVLKILLLKIVCWIFFELNVKFEDA